MSTVHSRNRSSSNSSLPLLDEINEVGSNQSVYSNETNNKLPKTKSGNQYQYTYTSVNSNDDINSESIIISDSGGKSTIDGDTTILSQSTVLNEERNSFIPLLCKFVLWARLELTGFFLIILVGTILGLVIPPNDELTSPYRYYSNVLGWIYFCAWSISFYPQLIENYIRKSAIGLSMDFEMLNLMGFTCYSLFTVYNHYIFHTTVVTVQDVFFALHALLITILTICQMIYYDGFRPHRISFLVGITLAIMLSSIIGYAVTVIAKDRYNDSEYIWSWSQWLIFVSYVKLTISTVKGMPQAYLNYKRKSTEGWNIHNIICDFTGGLLSTLQLLLDCNNLKDWSQINNDPAKFGLGLVSMVFDIIFLLQHFVLYPRSKYQKERDLEHAFR